MSMSKPTLSIRIPDHFTEGNTHICGRTIEVPCRLPEAFTVRFAAKGSRWGATAYVTDGKISDIETNEDVRDEAQEAIDAAWLTILATLGITGPVPPGSPLPAIALAYEAEVAAYEASLKAFNALPVELVHVGLCGSHPDSESPTGIYSPAARMLAKYVEHVVEQAAKEVK